MKLAPGLLDILACPRCHAPLRADEAHEELACTSSSCGLIYPVRDDIPVLLIGDARAPEGRPDPRSGAGADPAAPGSAPGGAG